MKQKILKPNLGQTCNKYDLNVMVFILVGFFKDLFIILESQATIKHNKNGLSCSFAQQLPEPPKILLPQRTAIRLLEAHVFFYLNSTDVYYLPKADRDRRSALIGYGERSLSNLNDKHSANTPHAYSIPPTINYKKGISFTSGRHVIYLCQF